MKTSCVLWLLLSKAHKIIIKGKKKKKIECLGQNILITHTKMAPLETKQNKTKSKCKNSLFLLPTD